MECLDIVLNIVLILLAVPAIMLRLVKDSLGVRIISWRDRITLLINLIFRRKSCPSLMMLLLPPHLLAPIKFKVAIPPLQAPIFREEEAQIQIHHLYMSALLSLLTPGKCFQILML
ncbi:hypothetical protein ISN44_As01g014100 [Arabidopsis suecica]|uniref:Uncharacterized protein n=1 Tax=Arabidopsis suecica TaxID=45249 RepID=A0A8T2H5W5_ARASU|nr:hypothetical protein ISN44_As01g014100 [Arabidopsis suecica]